MKQQQQVIMALDLLIKEDKEVKTPYVDFLPKFVYGALDWTNETAELSAHFNLVSKLKARNKTAVNLYYIIYHELVQPGYVDDAISEPFRKKFTFQNFKRAWVTVSSHSHGVVALEKSVEKRKLVVVNTSLVPLADLFAHDAGKIYV